MLQQCCAVLSGLLLAFWCHGAASYASQRRSGSSTMGGQLHAHGYFTNDLDILPYGVLQQLQDAAAVAPWRYSRLMDWQTVAAASSQHERVQSIPFVPKTLHRQRKQQQQQQQQYWQHQQQKQQQRRLRSSQAVASSKRMPRLQRVHDNFYNLYDGDGDHLLGLHYHNDHNDHNDAPAAPYRSNAKSSAATATDDINFNAAESDWRPIVAPTLSTARPAPKPQLQPYRTRRKSMEASEFGQTSHNSPLLQRDGRQVQHFWLQL